MGAGVAAAAVGLGVAQLLASFFSPAADVRTSVGTAVINLTPGPAKEWAIQTFGTADKLFLSVMVVAVMTTAERNAITSPCKGMVIYNDTTNDYEGYETSWKALGLFT